MITKTTIPTILLGQKKENLLSLESEIEACCPKVSVMGMAHSISTARKMADDMGAKLIFVDLSIFSSCEILPILKKCSQIDQAAIALFQNDNYALDAIKACISGYVVMPVRKEDLVLAVENAWKLISLKEEKQCNQEIIDKLRKARSDQELIGVPTLEGFDFFQVDHIIRCEGLQKCTRIVTTHKTNIVSSYNIGEFRKMLEPYGFFMPHKSFLINLNYIKKYNRVGLIVMADNASVPVSRSRKHSFLERVVHL